MSQKAAARRRRQAANGYRHICKAKRPGYKKRDAMTAARRLANQIATERRMSQGKKK